MLVIRLGPGVSPHFFRCLHQAATKNYSAKTVLFKDQPPSPRLPRLKGSILRPSLFNVPQPRLDPQPVKTSMMIRNRIRARENRKEKQLLHMQYLRDMREEFRFWERLGLEGNEMRRRSGRKKGSGEVMETGFLEIHDEQLQRFDDAYKRDAARAAMKVPQEMIKRVDRARKDIARSKQRQAQERKAVQATARAADAGPGRAKIIE